MSVNSRPLPIAILVDEGALCLVVVATVSVIVVTDVGIVSVGVAVVEMLFVVAVDDGVVAIAGDKDDAGEEYEDGGEEDSEEGNGNDNTGGWVVVIVLDVVAGVVLAGVKGMALVGANVAFVAVGVEDNEEEFDIVVIVFVKFKEEGDDEEEG